MNEIQTQIVKELNDYMHYDAYGEQRWSARDIMPLFGYVEWRTFLGAIKKAKITCQTSGNDVEYHFVGAHKMVMIGSGAQKEIEDFELTRYACDLTALAGDVRKPEIALAHTYFSIKTRTCEKIEDGLQLLNREPFRTQAIYDNKAFAAICYQKGLTGAGCARAYSQGDKAYFGGYNTAEMKDKLGISQRESLDDVLDNAVLAGRSFATALTNLAIKDQNLYGEEEITKCKVEKGNYVRSAFIKDTGRTPESFPANENYRKLESRVNKNTAKISKPFIKRINKTCTIIPIEE